MISPTRLSPYAFLLVLALPFAATAAPLETAPIVEATIPNTPAERVWIAWLDHRTLNDALATRARFLDRFPDAVLVSDGASAEALRIASFRLEPVLPLPAGAMVSLVHRERRGRALDAAALAKQGVTVLWQSGDDAILAAAEPIDAGLEALSGWHPSALRTSPLRRQISEAAAKPLPETHATDFAPIIQEMVDQVSGPNMITDIGRLAGRGSVLVGGNPVQFTTRSTPTTKCDQAEQYTLERFQAMGYTDVVYDPFTFSTTSARNVVATKPGASRPGRVIILGGHLDSTSPSASTNAPGANDNASGIAGIFAIANILKDYEFDKTIRFIAFTGEEQGLRGSQHYANAAAARGDSIDGVVIFDMIGWKNLLNQIDIEGEAAWLPIMNVMDDACAEYTGIDTQIQLVSFGSDHVPFQDNNFSAFLAIESEYDDYPCYHQTCDTTGWNQPQFLAETVKAGLATIAHLAGPRDFNLTHVPLESTDDAGPYEVVVNITQIAAMVPDSLQLHWSTGGAFTSTLLTSTGTPGQYHAYIPGQTNATVQYWISIVDVEDRRLVDPENAPASLHEFVVAPRVTLLEEGFETGAAGWTHGGAVDDWQVATPAGLAEDPATAHGGTKIAGNDITGLGAVGGRYEPNAENWFESPAIDCTNRFGTRLEFWRDLAIERSNGGSWDWARVQVNGTTVWESPSALNLNDAGWQSQVLDISSVADNQPSVKIRFTLHSDVSIQLGGWNLDDIRVSGLEPTTVDVPLAGVTRGRLWVSAAPNPGRFGTTLHFELPRRERVHVGIYDVRGRLVRTLAEGARGAGRHDLAWDGRAAGGAPCEPGVYFGRVTLGGESRATKLVLLR